MLDTFFRLLPIATVCVALCLAIFVLNRNRRSWANRWFAIGLFAIALHLAFLIAGETFNASLRLTLARLALGMLPALSIVWLAFGLAMGSDNGHGRAHGWQSAIIGVAGFLPAVGMWLAGGHMFHPFKIAGSSSPLLALDVWGKLFFSGYLLTLLSVLLRFENIYRYADRKTRYRIRYLVVGIFVALGYQVVSASVVLLYGFVHPMHAPASAAAFLLGQGMMAYALFRHRLLDVDVFVSRYIIYRSITLGLVGGYLVFLGLVTEILQYFALNLDLVSGTLMAIAGGGALALFILSETVQRKTKTFIHAHFYKHKYDYHHEWMEFTGRLSRATSVPEIGAQTVNRILEVMWVQQAAVYVGSEAPDRMVLVHQAGYETLPSSLSLPESFLDLLRRQDGRATTEVSDAHPFRLETETAVSLFGGAPIGCVVPIAALDTLVGLLVVGPERSGKPFGADDRDLLMAVAAQAGAQLLNARLAQEASEGRELRALARLSAFVAHDLKNSVSMLSMLAENARQYMHRAEFQAETVKTLDSIVARMRHLMLSLTSPGDLPRPILRPVSLTPAIEGWLSEIAPQIPRRIRIESRLDWTPSALLDPDQFRAVVLNLLMNAVEATPGEGIVTIETFQQNGEAVLAISDTGRGMSQVFIREKLFRPFQTTKAKGLGIGLYQCRSIVQQLGGTINVESEEGKGTRMIVRLPAVKEAEAEAPKAYGSSAAR